MARKRTRTRVAWYKVYLALTAFSTGLLGLVLSDVPPFGGLTPVAASALIVALFAVASVGYWYDVSRGRRSEETPPDFLRTLDEEVGYRDDGEEEDGDENGPNGDGSGSNGDGSESNGDGGRPNGDEGGPNGDEGGPNDDE